MATLREAIPDYRTNGIFKNIPGISEWDMSPEILDITLMGKYGNKTINTLMREFTNNQGVVTDMSGLTNLVWQYHQNNWMKLYDAMRQDYNPIKPYSKDIEASESVETETSGTTANTTTNNLQKANTGTQSDAGEIRDIINETHTDTLSGSDETEKTGDDTVSKTGVNYKEYEVENLNEDEVRTMSGSIQDEKHGRETVRNYTSDYYVGPDPGHPVDHSNRTSTETYSDNNITPLENERSLPVDIGTSHDVTKDNTKAATAQTSESVNAANPYDETVSLGSVNISDTQNYPATGETNPKATESTVSTTFKPTDKQQSDSNNVSNTDHELSEKTVDKSASHNKTYTKKDEFTDTMYPESDQRMDVRTFDDYKERVHKGKGDDANYSAQREKYFNGELRHKTEYDSAETTTYGKVDTKTDVADNRRTTSNTRTDNLNEMLTGTVQDAGTSSGIEDISRSTQSNAVGNLGFMTSQRQLEEEIRLRQKHFYDDVLKDVAELLTVGVYA